VSTAVLIASTMGEGRSWLADQPAPPARVVIVTPRSPNAARGYTADAVLITPAARQLPADVRQRLVASALPCVMVDRAGQGAVYWDGELDRWAATAQN